MSENNGKSRTELRVTPEEAQHLANLLRYAVSLNTTAGLISPTERRLSTSTYRAVELAARVLEGRTFDEALEESCEVWSGSLEEDHHRALEILQNERDPLIETMSAHMTQEQLTEYLEVAQNQFLELLRHNPTKEREPGEPGG
jgi:hypothetical protein